ncbi:DUF4249 domain-containing protein [Flavobacterium sp. F372]|uniref:DUF4249 domain-containing protein n=1 Tax=Flavobacterium bernardetii TaxID=2813823 RepID=A0ABR7J0M3_9FLAO|nr:DUF4249 domain-containing protein [Flavobacterium bernardetii]MBC5835399.1 DUF4249 domain-containing protein [Flavobacterium bernardetii]NHF69742.1 DUF4249 domain-containing protein [Flavobacterium bernardetii]
MKKLSFLLFIVIFGCTEPYLLETSNFEEALVIEATITNQLKKQQIKLTKTYRLEESGPEFVENATVTVEDDLGNIYNFIEGDKIYESENPFQAIAGRKYKLTILTDGKTYTSTQEVLTTETQVQSLEVSNKVIDGVRGAEIELKSFDPTNSSKYYRYEYEETYKIIAPRWVPHIATVIAVPHPTVPSLMIPEISLTPRTYEARVCYSSAKSEKIILFNSSNLSEDRVNLKLRFIPVSNPIIKHRYSILAKQYVQSLEAHTFYSTLKKLSENQSILSQNQPGFFSGNISCSTNPNEKVIGFFDVSSYSEKRMFFNFVDIFSTADTPGYFYECFWDQIFVDKKDAEGRYKFCFLTPPPSDCEAEMAQDYLQQSYLLYYKQLYIDSDKYVDLVPPPCGDCTTFSSNVIPPFWQ